MHKSYFKPIGKVTVRKVTDKTRHEVFDRDNGCVICGTEFDLERTPHHAWYGGAANRSPDRNTSNQLVTICRTDHRAIHDKGDREKRQYCIDYLNKL